MSKFNRQALTMMRSFGFPYGLPCLAHAPCQQAGIDDYWSATNQHLLRRGLRMPEDVSLISSAYLTELGWCQPSVTPLHWEPNLLVRRVLRWVDNISRVREDTRQSGTKARLIEGGTLGSALLVSTSADIYPHVI